METVGEGERGTNRHGSTGLYTLPRVGQSASGGLPNSSELTSVLRAHLGAPRTWGGREVGRREAQEGEDICLYI